MNASTNNLPLTLRTTNSGFTLIELMVTIAVLAIIVGIAAPSISNQLANQRVKSTTATLVNALKEAKVESVIRRQEVEFSFDDSTHSMNIETKAVSPDEVASYSYSSKSTIKANKSSITFSPSKRADAVIYNICDDKSSATMQVIVTEIANISTILGGSC
ncbi:MULTISPECIES: prepilin-type N-terminal cleavage/methylation domain-containing protein [Psychrobacter]|uniref:prepilin-type N-terminal cleavage/methylation domain-containing protein n=1 Tax=Psychrobacter TaxID=497 RepID=UPI00191B155A|nr:MULTISPECIES: prepilin-type N-terminal cleavage/methylation domain-containing protein [Psychrobacter]MCG3809025.1 prepilin-type N-terminal cleavage/methylation domain-containing protein [Psychrobacter sp. Ps4]